MRRLICLFLFMFFPNANALIDLRGTMGFDIISPYSFNRFSSSNDISQTYLLPGMGYAAYVKPFPFQLGLGVEYLSQNIKVNAANSGDYNVKTETSRYSAKIYYHIFENTFFYTGPIVGYGIAHKIKIFGRGSALGNFEYNSGKATSASLSWEAGFKIGFIQIGIDMGFQHYKISGVSGPSGVAPFDLNYSGYSIFGFMGLVL